MLWFYLCFVLVLVHSGAGQSTPCPDAPNKALVKSLTINNCNPATTKCQIFTKSDTHVNLLFIPEIGSSSLTAGGVGTVGSKTFDIPFTSDWCAAHTGQSPCPFKANDTVELHETTRLTNFNLTGDVAVRFTLKGDSNQIILCANMVIEYIDH